MFNFIEVCEILDGLADIVVESLRFDEDDVAFFVIESVELRFFGKGPAFDLGIEVERQKTEVVTGKIILITRVAEADD